MVFVDVSSYQTIQEIQDAYNQLKFDGIIIKLTQGVTYVNPLYVEQIAFAKDNKLGVAFYHFLDQYSQAELNFAQLHFNDAVVTLGSQPEFYAWDIETLRAVDSIPNLPETKTQLTQGKKCSVYVYTDQTLARVIESKTHLPLWLAVWQPQDVIDKVVDALDDASEPVALVQDTDNADNLGIDEDETAPTVDTDTTADAGSTPSAGVSTIPTSSSAGPTTDTTASSSTDPTQTTDTSASPTPTSASASVEAQDVVSQLENPTKKQEIEYLPGRVSVRWTNDKDGNGWCLVLLPAEYVVSIVAQGSNPPKNGYWKLPTFGIQEDTDGTIVSWVGAEPNSTVEFWIILR